MAKQLEFFAVQGQMEGENIPVKAGHYGPPAENLIGRRFRKLVVIQKTLSRGKGARWLCRCDCGNTRIADAAKLKSGKAVSCGCARLDWSEERRRKLSRSLSRARKGLRVPGAGRKAVDIAGMKFGRWRVIGLGRRHGAHITWLCECECGTRRVVAGTELRLGRSKSCGCAVRRAADH